MSEILSLQAPLIQGLASIGWKHIPGNELDRDIEQPFVEPEVVAALIRLNPRVAQNPERADEILRPLRALTLAPANDGLVEVNRDFTRWLRGLHDHQYVGETGSVPVRLIDFDNLDNNTFVISDEVSYGSPGHKARFDIVLWINGFPIVVGELKTPVSQKVSWMKGASEVVGHYQPGWPAFFVPNAVVFASEGKEFMYAGVGTPVKGWEPWGATAETPKLASVLTSAKQMLSPRTVLDLLADFTLFERPDNNEGTSSLRKLVARYTQYEAVTLIVERARDATRRRGLIFHTQGAGKTLTMVLAAAKLLSDPAMQNPTVVLIADRVQLARQMWDQFRTTGMPRLVTPESAGSLRELLASKDNDGRDQRGLIFTTVHKFRGAPVLNTRRNIVVMVDEAHRTQEGDLGATMRAALPQATMFAYTGTPIAELDRNTFETFGDEDDPGKTLHTYDSDQSIADGTTVPIHVAPRKVEFALDKDALDEAFKQLANEEDLTDEQAEVLTRKASRTATFFGNPARVAAVCADIVEHFYSRIDPSGMKAQVVVFDRSACVAYVEELTRLLTLRHDTQLAATGPGDEPPTLDKCAVVMTVSSAKDEEPEWRIYALSDAAEEAVLKRFRTFGDPLKFLVCTAKLGTGFNAPIEGVMYLDKPLKKHTLYQTITRTNRPWTNPASGKDKRYGTIVDYVGLGDGFARAMSPANPDQATHDIDIDGLIDMFEDQLEQSMLRFAGLDPGSVGPTTVIEAQSRLPTKAAEDKFAGDYLVLEGIWEALAPELRLAQHKAAYRFLAQVYSSIQPSGSKDEALWQRLGTKTLELVHAHIGDITVSSGSDVVVADAETIKKLVDEGLIDNLEQVEHQSADEIVDSIAKRLKNRMAGAKPNSTHPVYKSLAERLERLRERAVAAAEQSIDWLREAFTLAKDVTVAERAEDGGGTDGLNLLPDPNVGALTQIFDEFAPAGTPVAIGRVVNEVDDIVKEVRYDGWASTQKGDKLVRKEVRMTLKKFGLHTVPGLFDRAYEYIAEHY